MKFPAALATLVLLACGPGERTLAPLYRFVEPSLRAEPASLPPTATLHDETRPTLVGHRARTLLSTHEVRVPADGLVVMYPHLPGPLKGAKQVLVQPQVYLHQRWHTHSGTMVPVKRRLDGTEYVEVAFILARVERKVDVSLKALIAPDERDPVHETPAVEIPRGSRLEFGIGLLATGPNQSAVDFSIEACVVRECTPVFERTLEREEPGGIGWDDHVLPLDAWAGREVSFRFHTHHHESDPHAFAFPVWSDPTLFAARPAAPDETRFILISLDTLRADHLPWYGYTRDSAPRLAESLVPRAAIFDQCVAGASTTGPSHMTMFTSLQPLVHGIRQSAGSRQIPPAVRTLAQELRAGGLVTGAVTENGPLGVHKGFGRGFDSFRENKAPKLRSAFSGRIAGTFEAARAWLESHGDKRFFLFVHTYEPHTPYIAPTVYDAVFADDPDSSRFDQIPDGEKPIDYDREIRYADHEVAEFLGWLGERGLLDDTVVILTSDHGEAFLEHGYRFHGSTLFEEILRVPLLVAGPGIAPGRVEVPVGLIDVMPTILELAGIAPPPGLAGRSRVTELRGATREPPLSVYAEHFTGADTARMVLRAGHKTITLRVDGRTRRERYDLARDFAEERDLLAVPGS